MSQTISSTEHTDRVVCLLCGRTDSSEAMTNDLLGVHCRLQEECQNVCRQQREQACRQAHVRRTRAVDLNQEMALKRDFGLTMSDLTEFPIRYRDACLHYKCTQPGREHQVYTWRILDQVWETK